MQALISTLEPVKTGFRVAQVMSDDQIFPVAEGLFWISCPDDVNADAWFYEPTTQTFELINTIPVTVAE